MVHQRITRAIVTLFTFSLYFNVSAIKTVRLSSGYDIPIIGFGTGWVKSNLIEASLTTALEDGYRHIDTAFMYQNEEAIGKTLKKWYDKGNKREDLFITSKLPCYGMRPESVEYFLKLSLEKLGTEYVDMYLLHTPYGFLKDEQKDQARRDPDGNVLFDYTTDHDAIWKEMEKQVKAGRAKSIGLCNFNVTQVVHVYDNAEIKPCNLQTEIQAYNQQQSLLDFCAERNISVTAISTLGSGDSPYSVRSKYTKTLPKLMENAVVKRIAENHNRTTAQILLQYTMQRGIIVIPKSTNPKRIKENMQIFDFTLNEDEIKEMKGLDVGEKGRFFNLFYLKGIKKHPQYPFPAQIELENILNLNNSSV